VARAPYHARSKHTELHLILYSRCCAQFEMGFYRNLGVACLQIHKATAWTYTEYVMTTKVPYGFGETQTVTVVPTSSVSATSTNITTSAGTLGTDGDGVFYNITVTDLWLGPSAAVCQVNNATCLGPQAANTATPSIATTYYAPYTVTNLPSCTQTSFSYTSSISAAFGLNLGADYWFPGLYSEYSKGGNSDEAVAVTTYISTISIDLGGQAVTTSRCDVYLKSDALKGVSLQVEEIYLTECVDPRRFMCSEHTLLTSGGCGTDWVGAYGTGTTAAPTTTSAGGDAVAGPGGGSPASTTATKPNGAGQLLAGWHGWTLVAVAAVLALTVWWFLDGSVTGGFTLEVRQVVGRRASFGQDHMQRKKSGSVIIF
jgi:hypothetical protein